MAKNGATTLGINDNCSKDTCSICILHTVSSKGHFVNAVLQMLDAQILQEQMVKKEVFKNKCC
jgi:hypothetical protein